jgi:DNA-binding transcriptional MerR regulator
MSDQDYSIQDLCEKTGLPRRTIHFYSQQGLLPPPAGAGPGTRYDDRHLLRLQIILRLRQQGLRLDDIRQRLQGVDLSDLHSLQKQLEMPLEINQAPPTPQIFQHYLLPGGMMLLAPATLSTANRKKLAELLSSARQIFGPTPIESIAKE